MEPEGAVARVHDHGYVRLVDALGDDLTVVNAARVSFEKESRELTEKDARLIEFLAEHGHTSPFRHAVLQFEVYAPLMVARQWFKYAVGSAHLDEGTNWNESSRRYVTEEPEFYIPFEWRTAPESKKQGSGGPVEPLLDAQLTADLQRLQKLGQQMYEKALARGVAAEQARLFLPAYGLYVRWRWTVSLQALCHFLNQRLGHDAQSEIRDYAKAVYGLSKEKFPKSIEAMVEVA